jgi:hypothetical protein
VQKDWKKSWVILPHISRRKKKCHFLSSSSRVESSSRGRQNFLFTFVVLIPERVTRSQLRAFGPPLLRSSALGLAALGIIYLQFCSTGISFSEENNREYILWDVMIRYSRYERLSLASIICNSYTLVILHKQHLYLLLLVIFMCLQFHGFPFNEVLACNKKNRSIWVKESQSSAHLSFLLKYNKPLIILSY